MKDKFLIDTSAWILSFKKTGHDKLKRCVVDALDKDAALTTNIIVLEILQGCRDKKEHEEMRTRLEALRSLALDDDAWDTAYEAGFMLRRAGIAVPTVDIIIASLVKIHGCSLLHHDRHFRAIAKKMDIRIVDFLDSK